MNRSKVIEAILKVYRAYGPGQQEGMVRDSLKWMSDLNLYAFATEIGIDLQALS